jgi:hypothetical protein
LAFFGDETLEGIQLVAEVVQHERTERAPHIGHALIVEVFVCRQRDDAAWLVALAVFDTPESQGEVRSNTAMNDEPTLVGKRFDAIALG